MEQFSRSRDDLLTVHDAALVLSELRGRACSIDLIRYYVRTGRLACTRTRGQKIRLFLAGHVEDLARALADADAAREVTAANG